MKYCVAFVQRQMNNNVDAIFPEEYYDIPGVEEYQDTDAVRNFALAKLQPYKGETVDLYVNGGMAIELLALIQAAAWLSIALNVWHRDANTGDFSMQPVKWKPDVVDGDSAPAQLTLCQSRHPGLPERAIYETVQPEKILDFKWQEEYAQEVLLPYAGRSICVYVTGLKPLCISVLNAAYRLNIRVIWMHYDMDKEEYFAQTMT